MTTKERVDHIIEEQMFGCGSDYVGANVYAMEELLASVIEDAEARGRASESAACARIIADFDASRDDPMTELYLLINARNKEENPCASSKSRSA